jgi:hypothetical protein
LLAARTAAAPDKVIKPLLDRIATVTRELEATEDRYAPIGFLESRSWKESITATCSSCGPNSACLFGARQRSVPASPFQGSKKFPRRNCKGLRAFSVLNMEKMDL